jgi:molybdopterin-guanine dinucleotide biosynthesis protein B
MRIVAVVGFSKSGKTRLITHLVGELKSRGLRAYAVKRCSHGFSLDIEGKDTSDFTTAGAGGVAMISPEGWAALGTPSIVDVPAFASRLFPGADVVLVEGGKEAGGLRKVEVLRSGVSEVLVSDPGELLAVVSDVPVPDAAPVPVFKPEETAKICDLILSLEEAIMADIKLEVDGREVNLNPFVRTFIERTVLGMVTSLSGVDPEPKKISLVIDRIDAAGKKG